MHILLMHGKFKHVWYASKVYNEVYRKLIDKHTCIVEFCYILSLLCVAPLIDY